MTRSRRLKWACVPLVVAVLAVGSPTTGSGEPGGQLKSDDTALRGYFSANGLLNRGLFELAAAEYEQFLSGHGDHAKAPVARYGLAVCLYRTQQYGRAIAELSVLRGLSGFEYAAEVGTMLGQSLLAEQRHGQAAEVFEAVVRDHGGHDLTDDAAAGLVEALCRDGQHDGAVAACDSFGARWPKSPLHDRARFFGARARMKREDYAGAARGFAELVQRASDGPFADQAAFLLARCHHLDKAPALAIAAYRRVLKKATGPYIADALLAAAMLLRQQGEPDEAGTLLDRLLKDSPDSPLVTRASLERGHTWFELQRFDRAEEMFAKVAGQEGDLQDDAAYWMAKCSLRRGDTSKAASLLAKAVEQFPDSGLGPEMCYDRGVALSKAGQHQAAAAALTQFRTRFADHPLAADALYLLAAGSHQQGEYKQSGTYCDSFLEHYPSHDLARTMAFLGAENAYLSGRHGEAVECYRRFLSSYPQDGRVPQAKFRLGVALYSLQRLEEARPLLVEVADAFGDQEAFRSALLALGDTHFQSGEWKQAQRRLSKYVAAGLDVPSADDALLKLGLAHQRQGDHRQALGAYERLIENFQQSPHRLQAMFERGQALKALNRLAEATEAFQQVLKEHGDGRFAVYALNHLGAIALAGDDYASAADYFARVASAKPGDDMAAEALFRRGQALMAEEQFKDAPEALGDFLNQYPSHERAGAACAQLAIALARLQRCDEALAAGERLERGFAARLDQALRATAYYEIAWCLSDSGRMDAAIAAYGKLLDGPAPDRLRQRALLELAGIHERAQRYAPAAKLLRELRETVTAAPTDAPPDLREQGLYRLAICEFRLERFAEVAELLGSFVAEFPKSDLSASAGFFCAEALFKLGRHQQAVTHLSRVVEEHADDPVCGPGLLRLGESLAALQRWTRSERAFAAHIERFGDSEEWYQARFGVGWSREHQQRYDEAIAAYRQVVERHRGPTAARAQFQIGECLFAKRQYAEAARELLKVDILYAYPEWSAAGLYEAGRCFDELGQRVEARAQYSAVVAKHADTKWARMASERLTKPASVTIPGRASR